MRDIKEYIKENEGSRKNSKGRHILYKCPADKWTCGYGRNLSDKGLSEKEAEYLLINDIGESVEDVIVIFGNAIFYKLTYNRKKALVDMVFNLGRTRFMGFKKMIQAVKTGDFTEAANQILDSRYARQLSNRSKRNADILREG